MPSARRWTFTLASLLFALPAAAQTTAPNSPSTEGLPIRSELVRARCGGCHRADGAGRMSRISYRRASPENWELTIKRMVSLNDVRLEPAEARDILKYLADDHGLAPEEVRPAAFEAERRLVEFQYAADKDTSDTCTSCHSPGRFMMERRTKEEWELLVAMHRGYYPLVDNQPMNAGQGFRRTRPPETEPGPDGRPPDNRHPMDKALEHLTKNYPLSSPAWAAWSAAKQPARLAGRWAVTGYMAGRGPIFGEVVITADPSVPDAFTTSTRFTVARSGETVSRTGRAIVYTGFQWRGRTDGPSWREVLMVDRGWREMTGRWFSGAYDETGIDVTLRRVGNDPVVLGTSLTAARTGASHSMRLFGANLPASITAADINMGPGVAVRRVTSASPDALAIDVDVDANATPGPRDVSIGGALVTRAFMVYDRIDGVKVAPQSGLARVGAEVFPKQFQQFEAIGINNGPDRQPGTADDLTLGPVDVTWKLEEYTATFGDDDVQFVGTIDANGLFTPNADGPNPKRSGNRNNVGDVWVVAELAPQGTNTQPIRARAHLLVTVPLYMNWSGSGTSR
jgi:quinohemoprotein amine dehydrogenase